MIRHQIRPVSDHRSVVAYYRTALDQLNFSGLCLLDQRKLIETYAHLRNVRCIAEFTEIEIKESAQYHQLKLAADLAEGKNASLLIANFSDVSRNIVFLERLNCLDNIEIRACDFENCRPLNIGWLLSAEQHRRKFISIRTKEGLSLAKIKGVRLGHTGQEHAHVARAAWMAQAAERRAMYAKYIQKIRFSGINTLAGIAKELNSRNIPAPRGGKWSAMQISRVEGR